MEKKINKSFNEIFYGLEKRKKQLIEKNNLLKNKKN
jgi:hypothetical protein